MIKIVAAVLVTCVVMIVVFQFIDPSVESVGGNVTTTLVSNSSSISVKISGEVTRPGTYLLSINSNLGELISTASGVTTNADELAYDTSYLLEDAQEFYIASKYNNNDVCSLEPITKVNINTDDASTLQTISGIGSTIATAIVNYRANNEKFARIEDIKKVNGIGNATFEKIKNYIRIKDA